MKSRTIVPSLQVPVDQMARAAFFSHYVHGFSKTYDVLERIGSQYSLEPHLATSVDAVSLVFFSFQFDDPTGMKPAREKYVQALLLVKTALSAPASRVSNSTFLAVLLLDLFEKITNRSPISSESWMSHVRGALALVKMRDPSQLKTYIGLRLSVRLFTNMLISCLAANASLPSELRRLHSDLQPLVNKDDPKWQVSGLVMAYADFRGEVQDGLLSHHEVLKEAKRLDKAFNSLAKSLPPSWISHRVSLRTSSTQVLERYYDVYPDCFTAQTSNVIRIMRILLNNHIRLVYLGDVSACSDSDSRELNAGFASLIVDSMAKEICATGPQFTVGVGGLLKPTDATPARKLHCYTLLFPFYVAARSASIESGIRGWVIQQLKFIADKCAMSNACLLADMLERDAGISEWDVYTMLGSYAFAA